MKNNFPPYEVSLNHKFFNVHRDKRFYVYFPHSKSTSSTNCKTYLNGFYFEPTRKLVEQKTNDFHSQKFFKFFSYIFSFSFSATKNKCFSRRFCGSYNNFSYTKFCYFFQFTLSIFSTRRQDRLLCT